eukprot:jgi/Bigna1/81127/fgenesh1_pg.77_\
MPWKSSAGPKRLNLSDIGQNEWSLTQATRIFTRRRIEIHRGTKNPPRPGQLEPMENLGANEALAKAQALYHKKKYTQALKTLEQLRGAYRNRSPPSVVLHNILLCQHAIDSQKKSAAPPSPDKKQKDTASSMGAAERQRYLKTVEELEKLREKATGEESIKGLSVVEGVWVKEKRALFLHDKSAFACVAFTTLKLAVCTGNFGRLWRIEQFLVLQCSLSTSLVSLRIERNGLMVTAGVKAIALYHSALFPDGLSVVEGVWVKEKRALFLHDKSAFACVAFTTLKLAVCTGNFGRPLENRAVFSFAMLTEHIAGVAPYRAKRPYGDRGMYSEACEWLRKAVELAPMLKQHKQQQQQQQQRSGRAVYLEDTGNYTGGTSKGLAGTSAAEDRKVSRFAFQTEAGVRYKIATADSDPRAKSLGEMKGHEEVLREALMCSHNALVLLQRHPQHKATPAPPLLLLRKECDVQLMIMYLTLCLDDPVVTISHGKKLLNLLDKAKAASDDKRKGKGENTRLLQLHKTQAFCSLNRPKEAAGHLKSPYLQTNDALNVVPADQFTRREHLRLRIARNAAAAAAAADRGDSPARRDAKARSPSPRAGGRADEAHREEWTSASRAALFTNLAICHVMRGNLTQGLQCVKRALMVVSNYLPALRLFVYIHIRKGDTAKAIDFLRTERPIPPKISFQRTADGENERNEDTRHAGAPLPSDSRHGDVKDGSRGANPSHRQHPPNHPAAVSQSSGGRSRNENSPDRVAVFAVANTALQQ